ncbi:MAG TPA: thioredoxin domain-containing protein [Polyangiaceae bacterium]
MASSKVQVFNELNFEALVLRAERPVLVDFTASWCGPCKHQAVILERVAEGSQAPLVGTVDVDECPELAARYGVRGMPTLLAFRDGKEVGRRLGLTAEPGIRALL